MVYHLRTLIIAAALSGITVGAFRDRFAQIAAALKRRPNLAWMIILALALVPMIWTTRNVAHYAVNVPRLDDWEMASLIVKQHAGRLRWHDIFEQQQEARTVLPKLIFLLSAATGEWDVRQQMAISLLAAAFSAAGVAFLLRRSHLSLFGCAVVLWIAVLCIFSPAQVEVWLLASGFPSFLPACFLVVALAALRARLSTSVQFAICATLALASSFTLAHGLMAWGLTFPVVLLMRRVWRWQWWLAAWVLVSAACALVYFWGYAKPAYLPEIAPRISAIDYLQFFFAFLGGGFAYASTREPAVVAVCAGALQVALLLGAIAYLARSWREPELRRDLMPWLALAGYSLGAALLATLGRVGYGASYSLASRYVPFSIYLTVADAAFIATMCRHVPRRRIATVGCALLCLAFAVLYSRAATTTIFFMRNDSAEARLARGAILFSRLQIQAEAVFREFVYPPDWHVPIQLAAALDDAHLLRPPLVRSGAITDVTAATGEAAGNVEGRFSGWAVLLKKRRPADCVLLSYENAARPNEWLIFKISDQIQPRADIVKRYGTIDFLWSGWSATPQPQTWPSGAKIRAWAVDTDNAELYPLGEAAESR